MNLIKIVCGFLLGAPGAIAVAFLLDCYFVGDNGFFFILLGLPVGALIGGVIGSLCAARIYWSHKTIVRLGISALIGSLIGTALWVLVPGRSTDPAMLAIWFTPARMLQQAPFGIVFGAAVGVAAGQIAIAVRCDNLPPTVIHIGAKTTETKDGVWPPAPTTLP